MLSSTTYLTTVAASHLAPALFERQKEPIRLYFHLVLGTAGEFFTEDQSLRFKQYVAGFVRATNGTVKALTCAQGKVYLLVGLEHTRSLADFVRDLKLVSRTFARKKLNHPAFSWRDDYEAFSVSLSQIERVRCYIHRQTRLDRQESYADSWQRVSSREMY
jgi:putative transposase